MRLRVLIENREVRAYTLRSNVRGRGRASALRHGLSRPCTHDEGRSCPSTLTMSMETNPARIGCAPEPCRPGPAHGWPCPRDPASGLSFPDTRDRGPSSPRTLTNPARIGCTPEPCRPGPAHGRPCPRDPASGLSFPDTHDREPSSPRTLTNPARIGCAPVPCRPGPAPGALASWTSSHGLSRPPPPTTGISLPAFDERFAVRSRAGARPMHPGWSGPCPAGNTR